MVEDDLRKKMTVLQYQNIKEFCEFYTIEVEEIKAHPEYAERIEEYHTALEELIDGYGQMGGLNQEICGIFGSCDCDADYGSVS